MSLTMVDDPFAEDMLHHFFQDLRAYKKLLIAVSGGSDSFALMVLLARWSALMHARKKACPLFHVVNVDHGLRAESADEARYVKKLAEAYEFDVTLLKVEDAAPKSNVQSWARHRRYSLISDFGASQGFEGVLTAHHKNDQAETFLLRLARGSGVSGLSAMQALSPYQGFPILRPLLQCDPEDLKKLLFEEKIDFIEDPSNHNQDYDRVQMRQAQSQLNDLGLTSSKLCQTADRMRRAQDAIDFYVREQISDLTIYNHGAVYMPFSCFDCPEEVGLRLLSKILMCVSGHQYGPRHSKLEMLYDKLLRLSFVHEKHSESIQNQKAVFATLHGTILSFFKDGFLIFREIGRVPLEEMTLTHYPVRWDGRFQCRLCDICDQALYSVKALEQDYLKEPELHALVRQSVFPALMWQSAPALYKNNNLIAVPSLLWGAYSQCDYHFDPAL